MKTLAELFELVSIAVKENNQYNCHWFINYSGHVNKLQISYYFCGWTADGNCESVDFKLDEEGIQGAYWYLKTRLKA
jgi:hypothetical protein